MVELNIPEVVVAVEKDPMHQVLVVDGIVILRYQSKYLKKL